MVQQLEFWPIMWKLWVRILPGGELFSSTFRANNYPYLRPCVRFISANDNKVKNGLLAVQLVANQALLEHMGKNVTGAIC